MKSVLGITVALVLPALLVADYSENKIEDFRIRRLSFGRRYSVRKCQACATDQCQVMGEFGCEPRSNLYSNFPKSTNQSYKTHLTIGLRNATILRAKMRGLWRNWLCLSRGPGSREQDSPLPTWDHEVQQCLRAILPMRPGSGLRGGRVQAEDNRA